MKYGDKMFIGKMDKSNINPGQVGRAGVLGSAMKVLDPSIFL